MMTNEEIKKIALAAGKNPIRETEVRYLMHEAFLELPAEEFHNIRRARIDAYVMDHYTIEFKPYDLLVGSYSLGFDLTEEKKAKMQRAKDIIKIVGEYQSGLASASTGHRVIDYEKLLKYGIKGVMEEIQMKMGDLRYDRPDDYEAEVVYSSMMIELEAVCRLAKRYEFRLREESTLAQNTERKQQLQVLADIFSKIPYEPASTFYEAIQSMWFMQFVLALVGDISLTGRMDAYLYPYYKKDLENGTLTKEFAFQLIEQLYFKHNEVYDSWPASIDIGGEDWEGNPVWNDITYMCVDAIKTTGLINPSVSVCYTDKMPEDLLIKCMEMIEEGYTRPSIFNDALIQKGLRNAGVSEREARCYAHSTCVEITPIKSANILVATPYVNLCKAFEYVLYEKKRPFVLGTLKEIGPGWGGNVQEAYLAHEVDFELKELTTFEQFMDLFKRVMAEIIEAHIRSSIKLVLMRERYTSSPLASAFLDDCIARGKDAGSGGAKFSYCYPDFPGVINVIDSLQAIKQAVYEEKLISLTELAQLCESNFDGKESIRQYLINKCPKFGNNVAVVDEIGTDIYNFIYNELKKYRTSLDSAIYPGYFAYVYHGLLGEKTDATPDGRLAGTALSEHLGAFCGRDKSGPVAVMRSISRLDQSLGLGGIATNYRFAKKFISTEKGKKAVADFVRTFMNNDCFEIQFNVIDRKDLLAAQQNPEKYQTLIVRVAGFSDYFINLAPNVQQEIIERTELGEM